MLPTPDFSQVYRQQFFVRLFGHEMMNILFADTDGVTTQPVAEQDYDMLLTMTHAEITESIKQGTATGKPESAIQLALQHGIEFMQLHETEAVRSAILQDVKEHVDKYTDFLESCLTLTPDDKERVVSTLTKVSNLSNAVYTEQKLAAGVILHLVSSGAKDLDEAYERSVDDQVRDVTRFILEVEDEGANTFLANVVLDERSRLLEGNIKDQVIAKAQEVLAVIEENGVNLPGGVGAAGTAEARDVSPSHGRSDHEQER